MIFAFTICAVVNMMKVHDMCIFVISRDWRILVIEILTRSAFTHFSYCRTFDTTFQAFALLSETVPVAST